MKRIPFIDPNQTMEELLDEEIRNNINTLDNPLNTISQEFRKMKQIIEQQQKLIELYKTQHKSAYPISSEYNEEQMANISMPSFTLPHDASVPDLQIPSLENNDMDEG